MDHRVLWLKKNQFLKVKECLRSIANEIGALSSEEVSQANSLFNKTFSFYGGYAQLSANAKDQIGESKILTQLINQIQNLKDEIA